MGNDWSVIQGERSSANIFFTESDVTVGNDWLLGGIGGISLTVLRAYETTIDVGGTLDMRQGSRSASELWLASSSANVGGDILLGELPGDSGDSALGVSLEQADITTGGSLEMRVGSGSDADIAIHDSTYDIGSDMRLATPAHDGSTASVKISDTTAAIGRDLAFDVSSLNGSAGELTLDNFTATVGRDLVYTLATDATSTRDVNFTDVDITVGRDVVIGEGTDFAVSPTNGELSTALLPSDVGRAVRVAGSLNVNDTFSRNDDLIVDATGEVLTSYQSTGDSLNFVELAFTGQATLGGKLDIQQAGGGTPDLGASGTVLTAGGGIHGAFDTVDTPDFGDDTALAITYESTAVHATRAYFGDATLNGGVGLKDFIITANNQGTHGTWSDGNFDNGFAQVDSDHLQTVIDQFGVGHDDSADTFGDLVHLWVDTADGSLSLVGNALLRGFWIGSTSGALDAATGAFEQQFDTHFQMQDDAIVLGDTDDGVYIDGQVDLASAFSLGGFEDLMFAYGLTTGDTLYWGAISYDGSTPPTEIIPTPTAAVAGLLLMGLGITSRRTTRR